MSRSKRRRQPTASDREGTSVLIDRVANWLIDEALKNTEIETLVTGTCERLRATGIPLVRGYFTFPVLHPLVAAVAVVWYRGQGTTVVGYPHVPGGVSEEFQRSPHYYMLERDIDLMRVQLDCPQRDYDFPVFEELIEEGITDYIGFIVEFSATGRRGALTGKSGDNAGMLGSWCTDRGAGFTDIEISALLRIQDRLAVAFQNCNQVSTDEKYCDDLPWSGRERPRARRSDQEG